MRLFCSLTLIIFTLSFTVILGQNLIPNPSFEDVNICTEHLAPCAPSGWISASPYMGQYRGATGKRYMSLIAFNSSRANVRQYLQTQLLCPLEAGETYIFSFKIKQDQCIVGSLGLLFSENLIYTENDDLLSQRPTLDFTSLFQTFTKRKQKSWIEIEQTYVATGKEKYLLIGNFQEEKAQQREFIKVEKPYKIYQFSIDDISLKKRKNDTICVESEALRRHWYSYHERHSRIKITEFVPKTEQDTLDVKKPELNVKTHNFILSDVIFEFNSALLSPLASNDIQTLLEKIDQKTIEQILIVGHTDNTGKDDYNLKLSQARAESVKRRLIELGIEEELIKTKGAGETSPISNNDSEKGRRENRRIEISFIVY